MVWKEVPLEMLDAANWWLDVFLAEDNFRLSNVAAVGGGNFKNPQARDRIIRPWQRAVRKAQSGESEKPKVTLEAHRARLAMLGVPMEIVPRG